MATAKDPGYVRLVDRLVRGCRVDIRSGWSIAGLDVREFPDDNLPLAQTFVRDELRRGNLEPCSRAEYEEANQGDSDLLAEAGVKLVPAEVKGYYQEAHVSGLAQQRRLELEAKRGLGSRGISYKDDKVRRAALLKRQADIAAAAAARGDELDDDDDDVVDDVPVVDDTTGIEDEPDNDGAPDEQPTPAPAAKGKSRSKRK